MEYVKDAIEEARHEREHGHAEKLGSRNTESQRELKPKSMQNGVSRIRQVKVSNRVLLDNRIVSAFESDPRAEPYRQLRTLILKKFSENNWRTLAITSAHRNAGKTLTALNLAIALSKDVNQTVLLADLDLKGPDILDALGISAEAGLVEHLTQGTPMEDILINPGFERLTILPSLPTPGDTSEILSSPAMRTTLNDLVNCYDDRLLIFDLPPLLGDDDALVFAPYVDATLIVVENGVTTPDDLKRCYQLLEGTYIIGTVLNKS